ncbi:hypothetical protein [Polaromonas sp.]|uniref:hypothetical protein n=1 Tax=Polaromonas sp. TaxID=1869339 RepID=UPI0032647FCB
MDYLLVHDATEVAAMWLDVMTRGPGWRRRLKEGFQAMTALYPDRDFQGRLDRAIAAV